MCHSQYSNQYFEANKRSIMIYKKDIIVAMNFLISFGWVYQNIR